MGLLQNKRLPDVALLAFAAWFAYPLVTLKAYFNHPEFINYYPTFRHWFLQRLLKGEFPKWNPYWGIGHTTDIEATIPIDLYSLLEIFVGPKYHWFQLLQITALLFAARYALRRLGASPWIAVFGALSFFFAPWVVHHVFMFTWMSILTGICLIVPQVILYFREPSRKRLLCLSAAIGFTLLGTRPDFWLFILTYTTGLILASAIVYRKPRAILPCLLAIALGVSLHAWQIVPLLQILGQSGRVAGMGLAALASSEFYQRLYLSLVTLTPFSLLNAYGIGALLGLLTWGLLTGPKPLKALRVSLYFLPLAFYWCRKGLGDVAEMDGMRLAPATLHAFFGFLAFQAATLVEEKGTARVFYLMILFLFTVRDQGQVILAHTIGLTWIPTRDNFMFDFSIAAMGALALGHWYAKEQWVPGGAFLWLLAATLPNPYYSQWELKPAPAHFGTYEGLPGADKVIAELRDSPEWRAYFTSPGGWEGNSLRNGAGEVTLFSSMINARYRDWAIYRRFGIHPNENWGSHPADYTDQTLAVLPPKNLRGFKQNEVYWWKLRAWPPQDLGALQLLGVRHVIAEEPLPKLPWLSEYRQIAGFHTARVDKPMPRAFIVDNLDEQLLGMFQRSMGASGEGSRLRFGREIWDVHPARITRYETERVSVETSKEGILVLTDLFHPFWRARLDGSPVEIFPALHIFRGIKVPAGKHEIELECSIPYFGFGCAASLLALLAWVTLWVSADTRVLSLRGLPRPAPAA